MLFFGWLAAFNFPVYRRNKQANFKSAHRFERIFSDYPTWWRPVINKIDGSLEKNLIAPEVVEEVRNVLRSILQLGDRAAALDPDSRLLGEIPEMDSMAVVSILTELEDRFGFEVLDDEISADNFESFGELTLFVHGKLSEV